MNIDKNFATIGQAYDVVVENYRKTGRFCSFPEIIGYLRREGKLLKTFPATPPFRSNMSVEEFENYLRGTCVYADSILPHTASYMNDPTIEEDELFPAEKDVFFLMNMPYMVEIPHFHKFFEITHVLKGGCTLSFEGESVKLSEGELCIVSPMSGHSLPLEPGCLSVSIIVRQSTFDTLFGNMLSQKELMSLFFRNSLYEPRRANYILLKTGNDELTNEALKQLVHECNAVDRFSNSCAVSLLNLYLARALRAANAAVTLYHYEGYSERDFDFALVLNYIQQNYRTVTLSGLAETFHFSETYLSKLIHKKLNQNFTDVLRSIKMNKAKEYLLNTPMKICEISEAVGYDSIDHFSRTFRKVYGLPPREYKKHYAEEGSMES